jgi:nucleoside triphosphate pyrophosphatase
LTAAGVDFRIDPAEIDEAVLKHAFQADGRTPSDCAFALAEAKPQSVSCRHGRRLVIGADQILVCHGKWLDEPTDLIAARAQLQALHGCTHVLATAICAVRGPGCDISGTRFSTAT